ncbi:MAG: VpaChn25_0724 family phage protein [Panacagrimonas sp.]
MPKPRAAEKQPEPAASGTAAESRPVYAPWREPFSKALQEHRRGGLLVLLDYSPNGSASVSLLAHGLELMAIATSFDLVRTELHWLREQGLVTLFESEFTDGGTITRRGTDVVLRRAVVPGVTIAYDRPEEPRR